MTWIVNIWFDSFLYRSAGAIAGIVIGCIFTLSVFISVVICVCNTNRRGNNYSAYGGQVIRTGQPTVSYVTTSGAPCECYNYGTCPTKILIVAGLLKLYYIFTMASLLLFAHLKRSNMIKWKTKHITLSEHFQSVIQKFIETEAQSIAYEDRSFS